MCLITNRKEEIATEDITVYKSLLKHQYEIHGKCMSIFYNYEYGYGILNETVIGETYFNDQYYDDRARIYTENAFPLEFDRQNELVRHTNGFHSFSKERIENENEGCLIFECTIPKGSIYVRDVEGTLYVSNKLILNKLYTQR